VSLSPTAECACPSGPEIPLPVIDSMMRLAVSGPDDADDIIDHLIDATEGIGPSAKSTGTTRRKTDDPPHQRQDQPGEGTGGRIHVLGA
jgi:hypothetical protein